MKRLGKELAAFAALMVGIACAPFMLLTLLCLMILRKNDETSVARTAELAIISVFGKP